MLHNDNFFSADDNLEFLVGREDEQVVVDFSRSGEDGVDYSGSEMSYEEILRHHSHEVVRQMRALRDNLDKGTPNRYSKDYESYMEWRTENFPNLDAAIDFCADFAVSEEQRADIMNLIKEEPGRLYGDKALYWKTKEMIADNFGAHVVPMPESRQYKGSHFEEKEEDDRIWQVQKSKFFFNQPLPGKDGWTQVKLPCRDIKVRLDGGLYDLGAVFASVEAAQQRLQELHMNDVDNGNWARIQRRKDQGEYKKYHGILKFLRKLQSDVTGEAERQVGGYRRTNLNGSAVLVDDDRGWHDGRRVVLYIYVS